jgi:hypothetical protein
MKKTILSVTMILALGLTGCDVDSPDPKTNNVSMNVKYSDGTTFGVTRATDEMINGGYPVYDISTGEQIGFIYADGTVNAMNGQDLGICQGALDEKGDFTTECTIPTVNPTVRSNETTNNSTSRTNSHTSNATSSSNNTNDDDLVDVDDDDITGGDDADSSGAGGQGSETGA